MFRRHQGDVFSSTLSPLESSVSFGGFPSLRDLPQAHGSNQVSKFFAALRILRFLNYCDCCWSIFCSTLISLSWCCYDSLLGDLENCSRLPELTQQFPAVNPTYFRAALSQLRTSLRQNCSFRGFPHTAQGLREEMLYYENWKFVLWGGINGVL